ncbi:DMT family transporter [Sporolactobacillus spathodeae]|uniref:Drug/metabolite transporter (DMT)-like permease n=1 Tax=Sporolactobacillus spathodeae TaxID=1465502 RepID=A0ABS2Q5L7_9BACL|nr:DMT family transporter [Sporolactobacillus spathodeae]MBM7657081.1 drug/metabolite transporter (DMT)-like permease [Sporolactobacillus spathodeae]
MGGKQFFTNKKTVIFIAVFCCVLWGSAYPGVKAGYSLFQISTHQIYSELSFAGLRFVLAGLMVLIYALIAGRPVFQFSRRQVGELILLGLFETTFQYVFFYIGLSHTSGVKASIMNATSVFFSVIIAHFIYQNDRITFNKTIGCLVGFLGVLLVNFSSDLLSFHFNFTGEGFIAIAAFAFSAAAIYGKRVCQHLDSVVVTGYQLLIGGAVLLTTGLSQGGGVTHFTVASVTILLYLGLLSALAFTLWTILLTYNKVGAIAVYNFLIPVSGVILSSIFLHENILEWKNALALLLVCFGIYAVNRQGDRAIAARGDLNTATKS